MKMTSSEVHLSESKLLQEEQELQRPILTIAIMCLEALGRIFVIPFTILHTDNLMLDGLDIDFVLLFEIIGYSVLVISGTWEMWRLICKGLQLRTINNQQSECRSELLEEYLDLRMKILGADCTTPQHIQKYKDLIGVHTKLLREELVWYKAKFIEKQLPSFARQKMFLREEAMLYEEVFIIEQILFSQFQILTNILSLA